MFVFADFTPDSRQPGWVWGDPGQEAQEHRQPRLPPLPHLQQAEQEEGHHCGRREQSVEWCERERTSYSVYLMYVQVRRAAQLWL